MANRATRLTYAFRRVEPPPRAADWSTLVLAVFRTLSGVLGLGAGHPTNSLLFVVRGVVGLSLVVFVGFKLYRVRRRVSGVWLRDRHTTFSVLLAVVAFAPLGTGIVWMLGIEVRIGF